MSPISPHKAKVNWLLLILLIPVLIVAGFMVITTYYAGKTIYELLRENKALKQAITNLTAESQIGYAKVLSQEKKGDKLFTRLLFVETDRDDPSKRILEKEYEIEGDVIYFDALIVKFGNTLVSDGRERALYLWRRVYGETMPPEKGFPIEELGAEPQRYKDICSKLSLKQRKLFWSEIWQLSNDPERLKKADVQAIYGNAIYRKLKPGLIYAFKISNTGSLYSEIIPAL